MSYEKISSISIKDGKVFLKSKANNDSEPVRLWECTSLTKLLQEQGETALHIEILKEYEGGMFQSTGDNKYTRALRVLRSIPEYQNFNWRNSTFDDNDPINANRKKEDYKILLGKALATKLEKSKIIVTKKYFDGAIVYLAKVTRTGARWARDKAEAKVFSYMQDIERMKQSFTNSNEWNTETL